MEAILKGTKVSRYTTIAGEVIQKHHVTMNKATESEYEMDWYFDFADVTHEELMELASRDLVIKARPEFKALPAGSLDEWEQKEFSVREILDRERTNTLAPEEKARRAVSKLSPEAKAALIAELTA